MLALDLQTVPTTRNTATTTTRAVTTPGTTPGDNTTRTGACRSCGAYGGTPHRPTCQPGRRFKLGRFRGLRRSSRRSAAVVARTNVDRLMLRGLGL
jgi:hypothetical protein